MTQSSVIGASWIGPGTEDAVSFQEPKVLPEGRFARLRSGG
ncbi:hypothetical protein [Streptomyces sp. NPDC094437]